MTYTQKDITLFDETLKLLYKIEIERTIKKSPNSETIAKEFNLIPEDAKFILNNVLEMGSVLQILTKEKFGYGDFKLNNINKVNTDRFIENGGFLKYFENLEKENYKKELEFEKTKIDLVLAKKMLKDYPKTKFIAFAGFVITIILLLKEFYNFFCN